MDRIKEQYKIFLEMCNIADYKKAEILLKDIIVDVISQNDIRLEIKRTKQSHDTFDYIGKIINKKNVEDIAIDLKISRGKLSTNKISSLLVSAMANDIKNIVLVSNNELTAQAKETANIFSNKANINFQVFGKKELDVWFSGYDDNEHQFIYGNTVHEIIKETSRQLAKLLAQNPEQFMQIEWRDLERIIATVFSDFGYNVELTPSAKDGGKDVIVWYKGESYIIEIKHWNDKNKVGKNYISDFLQVIIRENRKAGLYLSSSGYTSKAFEALSKIEKTKFRYGDKTSMITLLKMYERVNNGIYVPVNDLEDIMGKISKGFEQ